MPRSRSTPTGGAEQAVGGPVLLHYITLHYIFGIYVITLQHVYLDIVGLAFGGDWSYLLRGLCL